MKIIAHRGFSELYPENLLPAFDKAIEAGVDGIETDVRMSRDGVAFIFHDSSLKRITGLDKSLESQNSDYLQGLDAGSWFDPAFAKEKIPTLDDLLYHINTRTQLILEVKFHESNYRQLSAIISRAIKNKSSWIEVSSFSDEILKLVHKLSPSTRLHKLIDDTAVLEQIDFDHRYEFVSYFDIDVALNKHPKTKELISHKKVLYWTIEDEDIKECISLGLYGGMSNHPIELRNKVFSLT